MKRGPFAPGGLCCPADRHYYGPLRLPLGRPLPFPGSPVMGGHRFPSHPQAAGPRRLSPVPETTVRTFNAHIRRRVLRRPLLDQRRLPWPSPWWDRLGTLSSPLKAGCLTTLAQASLSLQTARSLLPRFAPGLSAHARGHRYRGPRRLPGPDSHRQAIPNLSLGLCHERLLSLMRPSSLGAPHQSSMRPRTRKLRALRRSNPHALG